MLESNEVVVLSDSETSSCMIRDGSQTVESSVKSALIYDETCSFLASFFTDLSEWIMTFYLMLSEESGVEVRELELLTSSNRRASGKTHPQPISAQTCAWYIA